MTNIPEILAELLPQVPPDLIEYFDAIADGSFSNRFDLGLNLFLLSEVVSQSPHFLEHHPTIRVLGGLMLEDGNTSDHHFYVTRAPLKGAVFFLAHDGDSRVVFPSLGAFLQSAKDAKARNEWLPNFHPICSPVATDQLGLSELITSLCNDGTLNDVVTSLIPSMDLSDFALLKRLAEDDDFFLGEAVAMEIEKRPKPWLQPIAELCIRHPHIQVVNAGVQALAAINRLR